MYNRNVSSAPGGYGAVSLTGVLMQIAKGMDIWIFIVGHVTKEGVPWQVGVYWKKRFPPSSYFEGYIVMKVSRSSAVA